MLVSSSKIVDFAKTMDHTAWRDPKSDGPYCALFVRHIFRHCGIDLPEAKQPSDWEYSKHLPQGPTYANSLAGNEIGQKISSKADLRAGDLMFWRYTDPQFSTPVISHVGIYAGNHHIVDRGTSGVHYRPMSTFQNFVEGRRPRSLALAQSGGDEAHAPPHKVSKITLVHGHVSAKLHGSAVSSMILGANSYGSILVNDQKSHGASFLVEMQDDHGTWFKGYSHDGRCTLVGMNSIRCNLTKGALSVHLNVTQSIKPRSLVITVVEK